jgi:hypothetical protein
MKKLFIPLIFVLLILGLYGTTIASANYFNLKVNKKEAEIKVFVGRPPAITSIDSYKETRKTEMNSLAAQGQNVQALVVFNRFINAGQTIKLADKEGMIVHRIWIAEEGVQGIGSSLVNNNDINAAYEFFMDDFEQFYLEQEDEKSKGSLQSAYQACQENRMGIYAMLVSGPATVLYEYQDHPEIAMLDPHYNSKAINIGKEKDYQVKYIDCPTRPDGIK